MRGFVNCYDKFGNLAARKDNINNVEETFTYGNYVQDPTSQQSFNRYAYCVYNPLKYTDPSGERRNPTLFEEMMRVEWCNMDTYHLYKLGENQMATNLAYENSLAMTTFGWGDEPPGGGGGGHNNSGGGGGNGGGYGGSQAGGGGKTPLEHYEEICAKLGITPGQPIPENLRNDEFLRQFQQAFFPDAPMDLVGKFTCEDTDIDFYRGNITIDGITKPEDYDSYRDGKLFSGLSDVYFNQDLVFCSPEDLFYTMGHELVHVSQYNELACMMFVTTNVLDAVMDFGAYSWEVANGGRVIGYSVPPKNWFAKYPDLGYNGFKWTWNLIHP